MKKRTLQWKPHEECYLEEFTKYFTLKKTQTLMTVLLPGKLTSIITIREELGKKEIEIERQ